MENSDEGFNVEAWVRKKKDLIRHQDAGTWR